MGPDMYKKMSEISDSMVLVKVPPLLDGAKATIEDVKIKNGQWINKGQLMVVLKIKENATDIKTRRIKSETSGRVESVHVRKGEETSADNILARISMSKCPHSTVMKNMCADCGADLEHEEQHLDKQKKIAMIHSIPELKVSTGEAESLGKEDERRLLANRRLVLLVDLDQTLIHTTNDNIPPNIQDVKHFQLGGPQSPWYHTRIRPKTSQFLKNISKYYELHIFTYGARLYAHTVAKFLDQDSQLFSHRILSRDECFDSRLKTANLPSLFPCGDHMVCIIDDREDVWNYAPNLVHVKPYVFFKNIGDINAPGEFENGQTKQFEEKKSLKIKNSTIPNRSSNEQKSKENTTEDTETSHKSCLEKDGKKIKLQKLDESTGIEKSSEKYNLQSANDTDDHLLYLEEILRNIHQSYYEAFDQLQDQSKVPNLKEIIPNVKNRALKNTSIVFSGVIPNDKEVEKSKAYRVAQSLGAEVTENITTKTTHLIAAYSGTAKVNEARKQARNVHIVTPDWLWCCAERWESVDERLYPLYKSDSDSNSDSDSAISDIDVPQNLYLDNI